MKILVVDDSVVFRMAISQALNEVDGINASETASNGEKAIQILKANQDIDLVTLDMEMPIMDGLTTIAEIRKFNKQIPIIVFSSQTQVGAEKTLEALSKGASDFVTKQESSGGTTIDGSLEMIRNSLVPKIKALVSPSSKTEEKVSSTQGLPGLELKEVKGNAETFVEQMLVNPQLIVLGCSTGGPDALSRIFKSIENKSHLPMLIVQHMPALFTEKLANMLNDMCPHVTVREAKDGDRVAAGTCLIAPGDFHMVYNENGTISLNQEEKVCFVRPSVDVLFKSVAENFHQQVLAIVLTGMGDDGAKSMVDLKEKGAYLAIQDKKSSSVWGMPGAVHRLLPEVPAFDLDCFGPILSKVFGRL